MRQQICQHNRGAGSEGWSESALRGIDVEQRPGNIGLKVKERGEGRGRPNGKGC